jgi:malic enzyme
MFAAAAACLADQLRQEDVDAGSLYPPIAALRRVTARIAEAVMREARDGGTGRPFTDAEIPARVAAAMWDPQYLPLVRSQ